MKKREFSNPDNTSAPERGSLNIVSPLNGAAFFRKAVLNSASTGTHSGKRGQQPRESAIRKQIFFGVANKDTFCPPK